MKTSSFALVAGLPLAAFLHGCGGRRVAPESHPVLPDLSGLAWIEGDEFLAVHDAKDAPSDAPRPRVSVVRIPATKYAGCPWTPLAVEFPDKPGGLADDMESACRLPDGKGFLICESGQEGADDHHLYHVSFEQGRLRVRAHVEWPVPVTNVEATEVGRVGDQLVFLYAERNDGSPTTTLRWATLTLEPLAIGGFRGVELRSPAPTGPKSRPMVGPAAGDDGVLYSVSSLDSGRDDGGYLSVVRRIGALRAGASGPEVDLVEPERLATFDGGKIESVATRTRPDGTTELWFGTDDEDFGGILRPVPR